MFWLLLIVYFIGLLIFAGLLQAFNENKDNMELVFCIVMLGFALVLFGAHLWYTFYTLMLLPWFIFLPTIPETNFWAFILLLFCFAVLVYRLKQNNLEG